MDRVLPETQGFASQRLARIDAVLDAYVAEEKIAGVVSLVARNGQIVHRHHAGMAVRESNIPMQEDTIFRIYSMTKPITSVAVLMLMEEGRLRLSDPVAAYLPAFQNVKVLDTSLDTGVRSVAPARPPTVHDLLTHTAGLSYGFDAAVYIDQLYQQRVWEPWRQNPASLSLDGLMETLASLPLAHHPGSKYRYSMATDILGGIVKHRRHRCVACGILGRAVQPAMRDLFDTLETEIGPANHQQGRDGPRREGAQRQRRRHQDQLVPE